MDYVVIFDVATKTRPWFMYVMPAIILVGALVDLVRALEVAKR